MSVNSPLRGGPLCRVSRFLEPGTRSARASESDAADDHAAGRFLAACAMLHALLEREQATDALSNRVDISQLAPATARAADELDALVLQSFPDRSLVALLVETGAGALFPLVLHFVALRAREREQPQLAVEQPLEPLALELSLTGVASIARARALAVSLHADLLALRHKYAAHQLALIYQALKAGKLLGPRLKEIESHFDECKAEAPTDALDVPRLPADQAQWCARRAAARRARAVGSSVSRPATPFPPTALSRLIRFLSNLELELDCAFPAGVPAVAEPIFSCLARLAAREAHAE